MPRTSEQFNKDLKDSIQRSVDVLSEKEQEYSQCESDRLDQFWRAAAVQNIEPTEALVGMMTKHYTSICDMVKNPTCHSIPKWNEKIGDLRNYTFLLDSLVRDVYEQEAMEGSLNVND